MSIIESFKKTIIFFDEIKSEGVIEDYALIGGLALSAWIRPRTTQDIDLAVTVSERIKWADLISIVETRLHKRVAIHKGTQRTNIKENFSFVSGQIEVDVISTRGFRLADAAIKDAVIADVFGINVKVVTPEYLILLKLLPLSNQDILDITALLKKADKNKLKTLAQKYYLLSKLESVW
ncbi:MAG: nucleotidyltransferase [Nitrospirae bacterium]|nr:nucleotidyltransferase [Nitrospirota bacterium]